MTPTPAFHPGFLTRPRWRVTLGLIALAHVAGAQMPTASLVDVGGRAVNVQVAGVGQPGVPTVVFESGFGSPVSLWKPLQADIARLTRTVAYDRAGTGASAPATTRRTVHQIATELHALLAQLKAPPPYVLVGHSYGGPIIHTFAVMFPKEVAGLVYIDPTDFMQTEAEMQAVFAKAGMENGHDAMETMTERMLKGAPAGLAAENQEIERAARDGYAEFRDATEPPDVPMTVFLAAKADPIPAGITFPGNAAVYFQATLDQRIDHFARLVRRSANAHLVLTTSSSHFVQVSEQDAVASEIRRVVSDASTYPDLERFVGEYQMAPAVVLGIVRDGDKLFLEAAGQPKLRRFADSPTVYSLRVVDATIEFEIGAAGEVTALTLTQNGQRRRGLRRK